MNAVLSKIEKQIHALFSSDASGHDLNHLHRVMNSALRIQEVEGGDRLVIAAAALLHDIHRIIENETGQFFSPADSLPRVDEILDAADFLPEKRGQVLACVEFHEEYSFSKRGISINDIETLILQDADNLDAIGAVGVGRTFAFGGAHGVPMWLPEKPFDRLTYDESERDPSVLHHFHSKLLKLKENMNTATGRQMAETRHIFMQTFLEQFKAEWNGER